MTNTKYSHVWYTRWLCFCQGLPVGSETGRAINESTIFLEPLCDLLLPLKSSYWCRIKSRQQSQIWVEVVYLTQVFHDLDKLDHIALPILGFILVQNPWPCPKYVIQQTLWHTTPTGLSRAYEGLWTTDMNLHQESMAWHPVLINPIHIFRSISVSSIFILSCQMSKLSEQHSSLTLGVFIKRGSLACTIDE